MLQRNEIFQNKVKKDLKDKKPTIGGWLQACSPITAEIMAKAGFDWLMVDMEHGPGTTMTLLSQMQAIQGYGITPFVRAPWNDFVAIKKILDVGVQGVLVPYVNTKAEAISAVRACKYPIDGIRGVAPSPRAGGFGMDGQRYMSKANDEIVVIIAIETPEAVENLDEILSVEGLDGIFIGPMDLATSMGYFCNKDADAVKETITKIEKKVLDSDKFLGTVANGFDNAKKLYKKGYNFIVAMSDTSALGKMALELVDEFNSEFGGDTN